MKIAKHPTLNILVREDGCVFVPGDKWHKAHCTFGTKGAHGYRQVRIAGKDYKVHRLVAETFIGLIPEGYEIDHINRCPSDNRVENLRIVTKHENRCNTAQHDRVTEQGRTHYYEDEGQARRESSARHYAENQDKVREQQDRYEQAKRKTHRKVRFSDGSKRWVPLAEAEILLKIPLSQRILKEKP